eukprot:3991945-Prymnesium_polylepis.1
MAAFDSLAPRRASSGSVNTTVMPPRGSRSGVTQHVVLCNLISVEWRVISHSKLAIIDHSMRSNCSSKMARWIAQSSWKRGM